MKQSWIYKHSKKEKAIQALQWPILPLFLLIARKGIMAIQFFLIERDFFLTIFLTMSTCFGCMASHLIWYQFIKKLIRRVRYRYKLKHR